MFNYKMSYTNNRMQTFMFGDKSGVYLDESGLFDYFWSVKTAQNAIISVSREPREIPVSLLFLLEAKDSGRVNEFDSIIDYDARIGVPGTLKLNGFEIKCLFSGSESSDYQWKKGLMRRDMTLFTTSKDWTRRKMFLFRKAGTNSNTGLGYPHDYPHDYSARTAAANLFNESDYPSAFTMRFYGPVSNPYVVIGGNTYQVKVTLAEGEQLLIDSADHTQIQKISPYGEITNVFDRAEFGSPGSGRYLFEKIKPGMNSISMSAAVMLDIELIEGRSTPCWYETDEDAPLTIMGS